MGRRGRDGGNKRGRTQRRDFRDGRPNVWKKSRPEPSADQPDAQPSSETGWMPFVMESTSFELFYKVPKFTHFSPHSSRTFGKQEFWWRFKVYGLSARRQCGFLSSRSIFSMLRKWFNPQLQRGLLRQLVIQFVANLAQHRKSCIDLSGQWRSCFESVNFCKPLATLEPSVNPLQLLLLIYCSFWEIWCNDNTPIHDTWNPPIELYGWMLHKCVLQKNCNRHFLTMNWCLYGEQKQCIVPEEEWSTFISTLKKPLPTTFRINGRYAVLIMCIWNQISTIS